MARLSVPLGIALISLNFFFNAAAQNSTCQYSSFLDALPGGIFSDTSLYKTAIQLSGYGNKIPQPNGPLALTLLVPSNKAFLSLLWHNGFFLPDLSSIGSQLPATVLYNVLVGSISPQQTQQYTKASMGTVPTAYGLLGGNGSTSLGFYAEQGTDGTWYNYFQSQMNQGLAGASTVIPVCGSYIYITDEVLVPSADGSIGGVQAVQIPDNLFGGGSPATPGPSPSPSSPASPAPSTATNCVIPANVTTTPTSSSSLPTPPSVAPSTCTTTLAQAAKDNGLSILSTALSQPAIASQMPDPANPTTFFAPIDSAFLNLLTVLNISITDALNMGGKLAGVILYHIHPDEALTTVALGQKNTLTTELGVRLSNPSQYVIGVQQQPSLGIQLSGMRQGNVAHVQKEVNLCGSTVFVIDQVLLPGQTLDALPGVGPVNAPSGASPKSFSQAAGLLDGGLATGIGNFINCTVNLVASGTTLSTTTNAQGQFAFPNIPSCALADAIVTLPSGLNQLATCIDSSTGLQPPYSLSALLSDFLGGANGMTPGSSTPNLPINLSPLTNLISSLTQGVNGQKIDPSAVVSAVTNALGLNSTVSAAFGDFFNQLANSNGTSDSLTSILTNAQTLISQVIGGNVLSQLVPGTDINQAVAALNQVIGTNPNQFFGNLTNSNAINTLLTEGLNILHGIVLGGNGSSSPSLPSGVGRRLLQRSGAPSPSEAMDVNAILTAVSQPTALLNQLATEGSTGLNATILADLMARCQRVAQLQLAPAASDLAAGKLTISDFLTNFSNDAVTKAVSSANMTDTTSLLPQTNTTNSVTSSGVKMTGSGWSAKMKFASALTASAYVLLMF